MELIQAEHSFCFETVFSHTSKIDFMAKAKALGYEIILVVIHIETTELNLIRVSQRVKKCGHNVPPDKIRARIPRMLENVQLAMPLCDQVRGSITRDWIIRFSPF